MDMHYHSLSHNVPSIGTPEMTPEMFRGDMSGAGGISPTDLISLLNEGTFDVSNLFPPSGAMDMFPTASHGVMHGNNGRDLGIIATP